MIKELEKRIAQLEAYLQDSTFDTRKVVRSELVQNHRMEYAASATPSLFSALCVSTLDPQAEGRVQYFTPFFTAPGTPIGGLPWAYPVSPFGGFDDCGVTWVPPAGSKLALLCENGDKNQAYYIGTFYTRTRGKASANNSDDNQLPTNEDESRHDLWSYVVPEYDKLYEGTRNGYLLGSNEGDQVKMPWNTDNHQMKDWDTKTDFDSDTNAKELATYPHQYGFKTPGKHYYKQVDGDANCNHRWSRVEIASGRTNIFMMKDDHLHPAGQWGFTAAGSDSPCNGDGEDTDCDTVKANDTEEPFANKFYKRQEEMRFYQASEALAQYQNPKCELPQSGIQIQSVGGGQFVIDDSVDQPQGEPTWNRDYDFGCTDMTKAKMFLRSQTGHVFEMNDEESDTLIRGEKNGIRIETALGNRLQFYDHTIGKTSDPEMAGDLRGIVMESTSKHRLEFHDQGNKQVGLPRQEGGEPQAKADQAYVLLRSGYGLQLMMMDSSSQEETQTQRIELLAPQYDNKERGHHTLIFQEAAEGPGLVFLRAGGNLVVNSYDDYEEAVGTEDKESPSNKSVQITGKHIVNSGDYYFNHNKLTMFHSESYIYLLAGRDCPPPDDTTGSNILSGSLENVQIAAESAARGVPNQLPLNKVPCVHPVVVGKDPFVCPYTQFVHFGVMADPNDPTHKKLLYNSLSDRVFASASEDNHQ
jgi:hypothetical protein